MPPHLLVTNDFPPKVGGIQNYLWELWRRLPPEEVTVLTTPYAGAKAFDKSQPMRVLRDCNKVLTNNRGLADRIGRLAAEVGAELVIYDPAWPLGSIADRVGLPYGLVLHGAEVTFPARLPFLRRRLAKTLNGAELIISAGHYASTQANRCAGTKLPTTIISPGVDTGRFAPLTPAERFAVRSRYGLSDEHPLVVGASRLVPRKGFDRLIDAVGHLQLVAQHKDAAPEVSALRNIQLAIVGQGRDMRRLRARACKQSLAVEFLGQVPNSEMSAVMGMGDLFVMPCRDRWFGLEQEGFGIVFLEAAASGVPAIAGRSGGSHEAVENGVTGLVLHREQIGTHGKRLAAAIAKLLGSPAVHAAYGSAARKRAVQEFDYDLLAVRLADALSQSRAV